MDRNRPRAAVAKPRTCRGRGGEGLRGREGERRMAPPSGRGSCGHARMFFTRPALNLAMVTSQYSLRTEGHMLVDHSRD